MLAADILRAAPPLTRSTNEDVNPTCKMCGAPAAYFTAVDFNRSCGAQGLWKASGIIVPYFRCGNCDHIFTEFCDGWSDDDFRHLIYNEQYILVDPAYDGSRSREIATIYASLLAGAENCRILDYGAGIGVFAYELTANGFADATSYDPYTVSEKPKGTFDIITCFEVLEHSPQPRETLLAMIEMLADGGCIFVSQGLQPFDIETQRDRWWYLAPRNGHISFFSRDTIRLFAEQEGLFCSFLDTQFTLARPNISPITKMILERFAPIPRMELAAPGASDGVVHGWHGYETAGDRHFRWTAKDRVFLGEYTILGRVEIAVPLLFVIDDDFLADCSLEVGDDVVPLWPHRKKWLVAEYYSHALTRYPVWLRTKKPMKVPADERPLGLAVFAK